MMTIDHLDREIIRATQAGLPLVAEPYQAIAEGLGVTREEVMRRMQNMQDNGIIRRIGAVPNHYKLDYHYNGMTVWNVDDDNIDELGEKLGQLDFISHCYHRPRHLPDWPYNLFAMVHSKTEHGVNVQVEQIAALLGEYQHGYEILYSTRILKKTGLRIS